MKAPSLFCSFYESIPLTYIHMKPIVLIVLLNLFCFTLFSQNQERVTVFGIKAGLNTSIFSASVNSESSYKAGFHVGGYMKSSLSEKVFFRPEVFFSGQGQKDEYLTPPNGSSVGSTTTTVNYLNVPLLLEFGKKFSLLAGPQVGFLLSAKEEGEIDGEVINDDLKGLMKGTDFSFCIGFGFSTGKHVNLGARLNYGLSEIFDESGSDGFPSIKNRTFHFYLGYSF